MSIEANKQGDDVGIPRSRYSGIQRMHHLVIRIVVAIPDAIEQRDVLFVHVGVCVRREGGRPVGPEPPIGENGVDL